MTSLASGGIIHGGNEKHHYYRQDSAPSGGAPLDVGDLWVDTTNSLVKRCTNSSTPTFLSIEGGTSATFIDHSVTATITASDTQSQGQQALTTEINEVAVVGTAGDVVTMPAAVAGRKVTIINNGANTLQIFPASGDNLGAGVDTSVELELNEVIDFVAYDGTNWHCYISEA